MGDVKFEVSERASEGHTMWTELKIKGKTEDVKKVLRAWIN